MIVQKLKLINFRNYQSVNLLFNSKINVITGDNAEGKTNIVEAIHFLSLARSFRTPNDKNLILDGKEMALIEADIVNGGYKKNVQIYLYSNGKKVLINSKPIYKLSKLNELVNVIVFEPKDVRLLKDSPSERRQFLDVNLVKKSAVYLETISNFEKILKERNDLLKSDKVDPTQLDILTKQLIDEEVIIVKYRLLYVSDLNKTIKLVAKELYGASKDIKIVYEPFIKADDEFIERAQKVYRKALESDIRKKVTSIGIHREDFKVTLDGKDIGAYGSQGENRLITMALKLSPFFLADEDKKPIVVLDDALSELDEENQKRLINFLEKLNQVFITTTSVDIKNSTNYEIKNHKISRRNP